MKPLRKKYRLGLCLPVVCLVCLSMPAAGWGQPIEQLTINYIEAAPLPGDFVNRVRAYVTVSAAGQQPVLGLTTANFKAFEDGREVEINQVAGTSDPMAVVLAVDTSGSMLARDKSGRTSMDAAKSAAKGFISMLDKNDRVALYSFNKEPILELDFSSDHVRAIRAVDTLSAKSNAPTRLYDTTVEAVKKAAEIPRGRRAIILLTDGKDENGGRQFSTHNANDVIDAATTKTIRVPIYTIGVGPKVDAKELDRTASLTGGRTMLAASAEQLEGFYQIIASQLKNQYLIQYSPQSPSGEHSLVIKVSHENRTAQDEKRFWSPPLPVLQPPAVSFISPKSTDDLQGVVTVKVKITPEKTVAKVRYYVDAALKDEMTTEPFDTFEWNIAELPAGLHILRVEVVDIKGQIGSAEITNKVAASAGSQGPAVVAAAAKPTARRLLFWLVGIVLLCLVVGAGLVYWRMLQQKQNKTEPLHAEEKEAVSARPEMPAEDDEDATIYIKDAGKEAKADVAEELPAVTASLSVVKSQHLDSQESYDVSGTVTIGRSPNCDINVPDKSVSRKHAEIYLDGDLYYVRDIGSKYGTKVDGRGITSGRTELKDGAQIELGPKTVLKFHLHMPEGVAEDDDVTKKYDLKNDDPTLVVDS